MTCWVVDASPLIFLAKLDRLELLREAADEILVPTEVLNEISARQDESAARIREASRAWLREKTPARRSDEHKRSSGAGELEAIALARESNADRIVMDDLAARRMARRSGLKPIGTLGLLLAARLRGDLPSLRDEVEKLRDVGFWTSESLLEAVLKAAGESNGPEAAGDVHVT